MTALRAAATAVAGGVAIRLLEKGIEMDKDEAIRELANTAMWLLDAVEAPGSIRAALKSKIEFYAQAAK